MRLRFPNLFLPGAPKCGTTWIATVLRENPDVYVANAKEVHFFDHPDKFQKGERWYADFFREAASSKWVCDGTPNYLATTLRAEHRMMAEHIKDMCPNAHFIISFRNPVDRALSSILHQMRKGTLPPFLDCNLYIDCLLNGSVDDSKHGVLEFGNYAEQLEKYLLLFDRDRFHFIIFEEDIIKDRENTANRMCNFLALNPEPCLKRVNIKANPSLRTRGGLFVAQRNPRSITLPLARQLERFITAPKVTLNAATREKLWKYYKPKVAKLAGQLGRNLDIWKANPDCK